MSEEEQETIKLLKKTIKNSNYCDSIGTGQIEILLNYIDELQKDLENLKEVEREICCEELITKDRYQDILKENAEFKKVVWEQKADMNKLINYIAARENKTHEEVEKEFEVGE